MRALTTRLFPPITGLPAESRDVERTLSVARLYLSVFSLLAIWLDPTTPTRHAAAAYLLLLAYVGYSVVVWAVVRRLPAATTGRGLAIHTLDILWASALSLFTEGPNSPLFLFFVFVLIEATYRWGARATMATAGVGTAILVAQAALLAGGGPRSPWGLLEGELELNRFLIRSVYLLIIGYLVGYLGEAQLRIQRDRNAAASIIARLGGRVGVRVAMQTTLEELLRLFGARAVVIVTRDRQAGHVFLWERSAVDGEASRTHAVELAPDDAPDSMDLAVSWLARRRHGSAAAEMKTLRLNESGDRMREAAPGPPLEALQGRGWDTLLSVPFSFGGEWSGRVFVLDPPLGRAREAELRSLQSLVREVAPAVENVYLLRRLRSRASAAERARVARELHDGVIQSLIGLEMQVNVLRKQAIAKNSQQAGALTHIQALLRQEIITVRELMEQMKPVEVESGELLEHLAVAVDKFRRETGLGATFVSELEEVHLSSSTSREIARIVQEALINVRRHSQAQNVIVRLDRQDRCWLLVIDDDGQGFDFSGRLSQAELEAQRKGPLVIKERVRAIDGELTLESTPGRGSRLEVRIPDRLHA